MRRTFLLLSICHVAVLLSCSNNGTDPVTTGIIKGTVTDPSGNNIVDGAIVTTDPPTSTVSTGDQGTYTLRDVQPVTYTVTATKSGYNPGTADVSVQAGQTVAANIQLGVDTSLFTYVCSWQDHSYWISKVARIWRDAKAICESQGGHLVTIANQSENDCALQCALGFYKCHIGFADENSEGNWTWITGEEVAYTNWESGEPNNWHNEDFGSIYGTNHNGMHPGRWNDGNADYSIRFILELE